MAIRRITKHGDYIKTAFAGGTHHDYINSSTGAHLHELDRLNLYGIPKPSDRRIPHIQVLNIQDRVSYSINHPEREMGINLKKEHNRYNRLARIVDSKVMSADMRGISQIFIPPPMGNLPSINKRQMEPVFRS